MKSAVHTVLAAAALALAGFAGSASAHPGHGNPLLGPNKIGIKLCIPHFEHKKQYLGIKKIGFRYYRVYKITTIYVNKYCFKTVVSVRLHYVPLPWFHRSAPAGV